MPFLIIITDKRPKINNGNEIRVAENEIKSFLILIILLNCSENHTRAVVFSVLGMKFKQKDPVCCHILTWETRKGK